MSKKVGIIGSGIAGITLLKALADQITEINDSRIKKLNIKITLIERGVNLFETLLLNRAQILCRGVQGCGTPRAISLFHFDVP